MKKKNSHENEMAERPSLSLLSKSITKIKERILKRIEEVPDVGDFKEIEEFANNDWGVLDISGIGLRVFPGYMDIVVVDEFCSYEVSTSFIIGTKNEIIEKLKSEDFDEDLKNRIIELDIRLMIRDA